MKEQAKLRKSIFPAIAAIAGLLWFYELSTTFATPHVTYLNWLRPLETAFMNGDDHDNIKFKWVPIGRISSNLQQAVILAEDDEFYTHPGYNIEAIKKAAKYNWKKKRFARGASTITMQLARNLYLSSYKSLFRKYKELLIAMKLERELTKARILEIYLNVVEWGDGIYGAEAAARHYFGKSAAGLTKYEAAFLAAILPRPRFFDKRRGGPYLQNRTAVIEKKL